MEQPESEVNYEQDFTRVNTYIYTGAGRTWTSPLAYDQAYCVNTLSKNITIIIVNLIVNF